MRFEAAPPTGGWRVALRPEAALFASDWEDWKGTSQQQGTSAADAGALVYGVPADVGEEVSGGFLEEQLTGEGQLTAEF